VDRLPLARPYVIFTGTIEPRKNVAHIITALAAIPAPERPRLLVVGADGTGAAAVRALPATLGIESDVEFLGRVPTDHVIELYRGALSLVYPSLMEGFGLPILEAMACGTPVITSNPSSMAEVAGGAALLVDPEGEEQLTDAIKRVARDPSLRQSMREAGMRHAASFSWHRAARETLAVFEEALGE
jgi:glycosyltransferase involved in cell wall biosynthesis